MGQKVFKSGIKRESGWLYYLDKKGNVARAKMARGGSKGTWRRSSFDESRC